MTTGPTDVKVTTTAGGPGGMPLALRLSEGLGVLPVERDAARAALIARARAMRVEIQKIFDDAARWNRRNVPWKGAPINPDPDGQLGRILAGIDKVLAAETAP